MSVLIRTHYKLAKNSIRQNRGRSFLTCLGIAIGVASIVTILSLTGSITNLVSSQVKDLGPDLIVVRPSTNKGTTTTIMEGLTASNQYLGSNLTLKDAAAIKKLENVSAVAPIATATFTASSGENSIESVNVVATNGDFNKIQNLSLHTGSFLGENLNNNVAVVGHTLSLKLFGTNEPVGKTFTILGKSFIVVGVLTKVEDNINFNNIDFNESIIVNVDHLAELTNIQIQQINIKAANTANISDTTDIIKNTLFEEKSGDNNFSVLYGPEITHPAGSLFSIISSLLTIVACVSLAIGGIGIMNIMLVSVAERTHEIGIRKSVGASNGQILIQFLFESIILSLLGGILGFVLAYVVGFFISIITPFAPFVNLGIVITTIVVSLGVGIVFGLYPALKAANKNPIDSLKHYR